MGALELAEAKWRKHTWRGERAPSRAEEVLEFWFGRLPELHFGIRDAAWLPTRIPCWGGHWASEFLDVDSVIRRRFGADLERARRGELHGWADTPRGRLALVIVLDQFSRNIHRGTPQAFSQDDLALELAQKALQAGEDKLFNPLARTLFYMPLMHREDLEMQERCLELYERALEEAPHAAWLVLKVEHASARRHRDIIARFGRFPHRNAVLGRESSAEESRFLEERFSSF